MGNGATRAASILVPTLVVAQGVVLVLTLVTIAVLIAAGTRDVVYVRLHPPGVVVGNEKWQS